MSQATSPPDFRAAVPFVNLSAAVYDPELNELSLAADKEGFSFLGVVEAPGFQAMCLRNDADGRQAVIYRGTPVTCGRDIADAITALGYDTGMGHTDIGIGGKILTGPYRALWDQWPKIGRYIDTTKPVDFSGHSLGAVWGLLSAFFVPRSTEIRQIVFAPFQAANDIAWHALYTGRAYPTIYGRARDFAAGHNHLDPETCHPCPLVHMENGTWDWCDPWPFIDESIPDHSVTDYRADVCKLAALSGASSS